MLLKNKSAVITGCNRGIGKKILEVFSSNGADIFACVRKIDKKFISEIKDLVDKFDNNITPIELDLEDIDKTKSAAKNILDRSNNIEILVNNAGMVENSIFQMTKLESIKKIFDVNFFSHMVFTQLIREYSIYIFHISIRRKYWKKCLFIFQSSNNFTG
jgi:3-oxoacyl-[acyl-carrier protein] reductase